MIECCVNDSLFDFISKYLPPFTGHVIYDENMSISSMPIIESTVSKPAKTGNLTFMFCTSPCHVLCSVMSCYVM